MEYNFFYALSYWIKISISCTGVSSFSRKEGDVALLIMRISISSVVGWSSCLQNHGGLLNSQQALELAQPWPSQSGLVVIKVPSVFLIPTSQKWSLLTNGGAAFPDVMQGQNSFPTLVAANVQM